MYIYQYPRPMVTVDIMVLSLIKKNLSVLLIQRKNGPFKAQWALPGGFIEMDETLVESASRELKEETALSNVHLTELGTFGDPGRDPRGRTVTILYLAILNREYPIHAGDDAQNAQWFEINHLPKMAFDHNNVIQISRGKLLEKIFLNGLFQYFFCQPVRTKDFAELVRQILNRSLGELKISGLLDCLPGYSVENDFLVMNKDKNSSCENWFNIFNTNF